MLVSILANRTLIKIYNQELTTEQILQSQVTMEPDRRYIASQVKFHMNLKISLGCKDLTVGGKGHIN